MRVGVFCSAVWLGVCLFPIFILRGCVCCRSCRLTFFSSCSFTCFPFHPMTHTPWVRINPFQGHCNICCHPLRLFTVQLGKQSLFSLFFVPSQHAAQRGKVVSWTNHLVIPCLCYTVTYRILWFTLGCCTTRCSVHSWLYFHPPCRLRFVCLFLVCLQYAFPFVTSITTYPGCRYCMNAALLWCACVRYPPSCV